MDNYFAISLDTINAAFVDDGMPQAELGRILNKAAFHIAKLGSEQDYDAKVHDTNGNGVGYVTRLEGYEDPSYSDLPLGKFILMMRCENAAFFDNDGQPDNREISRILYDAASKLESISNMATDGEPYIIRDLNGDAVGQANWTDQITPVADPSIKAIIDAAEDKLGQYIAPAEAFIVDKDLVNRFFAAHSLYSNPLDDRAIKTQAQDTLSLSDDVLWDDIGSHLKVDDVNALAAALLTFKYNGSPDAEALQEITDQIVSYVREEELMFAMGEEEVEINQAIDAFRFPERETEPSTPSDPCF